MPSTAVTLVIFVLAPLFFSVRPMEHGMEMLQLVKVSVIYWPSGRPHDISSSYMRMISMSYQDVV